MEFDICYETALRLKECLQMLCNVCKDLKGYNLLDEEWNTILKLTKILKHFKKVSDALSGEKYVTISSAVVMWNLLLDKIESIEIALDDAANQNEHSARNIDSLILGLQQSKEKLIEYYDKVNWIYCVSLVLDPRHKQEGFRKSGWGRELEERTMKKFKELYKKYCRDESSSTSTLVLKPEDVQTSEDEDESTSMRCMFKKECF